MEIAYHELSVTGSFAHTRSDWERSINLLSEGGIDPQPLNTHGFPLARWEEGMRQAGQGQAIKVLLVPHASRG